MHKLIFILSVFVICAFDNADINPDYNVEISSNAMVTDNLSNVYLISDDRFLKYDMKLKLQKEFSNKNFGNITTADVTNPLRPLLFYQEFGRIVFLDNTLSLNGEPIALEKLGYPLATLAASSYDNSLWIYDQPSFELIRFNTALEITNRTGNLSQILGIELQPNFILEKDNRLFVNNPKTGILVFDVFGTYIKTIPILDLTNFQVADDQISYFRMSILKAWNITTAETTDYTQPQSATALNMRLEREAIFVQDSAKVSSYIRKK